MAAKLPAVAVIVGVPVAVSSYWKVAALVPAAIVSGEAGRNVPFADVVARLTEQICSTLAPGSRRHPQAGR